MHLLHLNAIVPEKDNKALIVVPNAGPCELGAVARIESVRMKYNDDVSVNLHVDVEYWGRPGAFYVNAACDSTLEMDRRLRNKLRSFNAHWNTYGLHSEPRVQYDDSRERFVVILPPRSYLSCPQEQVFFWKKLGFQHVEMGDGELIPSGQCGFQNTSNVTEILRTASLRSLIDENLPTCPPKKASDEPPTAADSSTADEPMGRPTGEESSTWLDNESMDSDDPRHPSKTANPDQVRLESTTSLQSVGLGQVTISRSKFERSSFRSQASTSTCPASPRSARTSSMSTTTRS